MRQMRSELFGSRLNGGTGVSRRSPGPTRLTARAVVLSIALAVLLGSFQAPALGAVRRLAGQTAEGTAAAISQNDWNTSTYVFIARNDYFADALAGVSLAYKYWDHSSQVEDAPAPILLTDPTRLNPETASEIGRLQAKIVVILGGVGAISPAVAASIKKIPGVAEVQRVWGENAPGTAKKIFERMRSAADHNRTPRPDTAIIATQMNFPDALAASSPAAANNMPILLSSQDFIPRETLDALAEGNIEKVIIVGGPAAISTKAELQLKQKGYQVLKRIWGNSEYDTAIAIAKSNGYFSFDYTTVYVARGDWFTDALAGGASASWMIYEDEFGTLLTAPAPIVLVEPGNVPKATQDWLSANRNTVADVYVLGGPGAIADSVSNSISQTLF